MPTGLSLYQLMLAAIALSFIVSGALRFFGGAYRQTLFRFLIGSSLWAAVLAFSLFPRASHLVSQWFGFGDNLNTLIFIGFVLVFIALFKLLGAVERLEQSITEIVRIEALRGLPPRVPLTATRPEPGAGAPQGEGP
jgi:hypothetical protein